MMYPFMTLEDETEVVHSDILDKQDKVKVYFERPVESGFYSAECYLPAYEWKNIKGFKRSEIRAYQKLIESVAHIIIQLAREGGTENACCAITDPGYRKGS